MLDRNKFLIIGIISIIFLVGFTVRLNTTNLPHIPPEEQDFYRDEYGNPYMFEPDSYFNYRLTENYLNTGILGDSIIDGQDWDLKSYYPPGRSLNDYTPLIIYLAAFFYKFLNLFTTIPLMVVCFWIPAFIAPISGIIAYLIVKKFTNNWGSFIAGILTVTSPIYFLRTVPGWFDTNMFNILFPLLIIYFLFEAILSDNYRNGILFSALSAIFMIIYAFTWYGWFYLLYIIIFSFLIYFIAMKLTKKNINHLSIFMIFIIFLTLFVISKSRTDFSLGSLIPIDYLSLGLFQIAETHSQWPNFLIAVAELRAVTLFEAIVAIGINLFFIGLAGMILILTTFFNKRIFKEYLKNYDPFIFILLFVWVFASAYSISMGIRFIILIIPPLVLFAGIFTGSFIQAISEMKNHGKLIKIISAIIIFLLIIPPILNPNRDFILVPFANDEEVDAANWIKYNTPSDTIIISDWSYGYFFPVYADRSVPNDGGSFHTPREYWINRAYSETNETLSYGIFRMLTTTGDESWLFLEEYNYNTSETVNILSEVLGLDREDAHTILLKEHGFNSTFSNELLDLTHSNRSQPFVIVTTDSMLDRGYWNFYFGQWDFDKLESVNVTYSLGNFESNNSFFNSSNNVTYNLTNEEIKWRDKDPYYLIELQNATESKRLINNKSEFIIILLYDYEISLVIDKKFENSLFTRLAVKNENTNYFEKIYQNSEVLVWKPIF